MGSPSDITRLIELGLNRYGAGDLDSALLLWEEALVIDPDNVQATSYIDYVRLNYEMLSRAEPALASGEAPFGIEEEPSYRIQDAPQVIEDAPHAPLVPSPDPVDDGWFASDDTQPPEASPSQPLLELVAEPSLPPTIEAREPEVDAIAEVSFEAATAEYASARAVGDLPAASKDDAARPVAHEPPDAATTEFQHDETTGGFRSQQTAIHKRDLGFVQAVPPAGRLREPGANASAPGATATADHAAKPGTAAEPTGSAAEPSTAAVVETKDIPVVADRVTAREVLPTRAPARRDSAELSQAEVVLLHAPTRKFEPTLNVTAPTRDLGLRADLLPQLSNPDDEELPTKQSDVRAIREAAAEDEATATDVMAIDPIEARGAQILVEIDAGAPSNEAKDDQTRRRIGALLERAVVWKDAGDLDRAISAVDLAMSEDPNSVLGQKLITRNRDTIMALFQAFVGDLARMPQLAKPLHELRDAPISPRAAFLLSRVDGMLTIDELLDVSGMPRMEAYRYLCQLFLRGILR